MIYNKLVRDKIPEYIEKKGEKVKYHVAEGGEYWDKLKEKLSEETEEFLKDESINELSDILEVIDAIIEYKKFSLEDIKNTKELKAEQRGKFEKKIILEES